MVGRPCGQFHGLCRLPKWDTTLFIVFRSSALPIMMELRQARMANIALTLQSSVEPQDPVGLHYNATAMHDLTHPLLPLENSSLLFPERRI